MTRPPRTVAVLDVGKTNAKVALVSADGEALALRTTPTMVLDDGPYPHFDIARTWDFACGALAEIGRDQPIEAISITAHGSAGALLSGAADGDGLALPVIDYEFAGPDECQAAYDAIRPPFAETLSPRLPAGLNFGAQVFWQQQTFPEAFAAARHLVNYPQYWAWRLCGVAATEMTSMGAHSDLWRPAERDWSSLVERAGWRRLLPPLRSAFDILGPLRPELAQRLNLPADTPVHCGIHDSNASLLPHLSTLQPPFAVVSTGTWVILFAVGAALEGLDPLRDTLANVNAYGDPVPCARFMGGREFDRLTGGDATEPTPREIDRVLREAIMALPSFTRGIGPFPRNEGHWSHQPGDLTPGERTAVASLYLALVSAQSLRVAGAAGPIVVEGPFSTNTLFCAALSVLRSTPVSGSGERTGTTLGAALLATGRRSEPARREETPPLGHPAFAGYAQRWLDAAESG